MFTINQEISKNFGCHVDGTRFLGMSYWIISCINGSSQKTYSLFVCFFFLVSFGWGVRSGYSCSSYRSTTSFPFSSPLRVLRPWSFHGHSNTCPWNKLTFPSCLKPLLQSEAKFKAIDMKMIFYSHANKTHFPRKVLQLACLKVTVFGTRKWSIVLETRNSVVNNAIDGKAFLLGSVRACLHEGRGPQVGEVTCGTLPT